MKLYSVCRYTCYTARSLSLSLCCSLTHTQTHRCDVIGVKSVSVCEAVTKPPAGLYICYLKFLPSGVFVRHTAVNTATRMKTEVMKTPMMMMMMTVRLAVSYHIQYRGDRSDLEWPAHCTVWVCVWEITCIRVECGDVCCSVCWSLYLVVWGGGGDGGVVVKACVMLSIRGNMALSLDLWNTPQVQFCWLSATSFTSSGSGNTSHVSFFIHNTWNSSFPSESSHFKRRCVRVRSPDVLHTLE